MGSGLEGLIAGRKVRVGSHQLIFGAHKPDDWAVRALRRASWRSALSVFVSVDGRIIGALLLADELRKETPRAVQSLRAAGIARIVMVTGDRADAAETIGPRSTSMRCSPTAFRPTKLTRSPWSGGCTRP